ncbi:MAG: molecular chaperone [Alphaproteobacteria bacterium]
MKTILKSLFYTIIFLMCKTASANIGIDKHYLVFDANSKNRNQQIVFSNTSKEEKTYRIKLVNYRQLENGEYEEISEPLPQAPFANKFLSFSPNQTTLKAGQTQIVRIQRKPMINTPDGEYVSRLLIKEVYTAKEETKSQNDREMRINAQALYAVTIPIIIQKGELKASAKIENPQIIKSQDNTVLKMTLSREGTKSLFVNVLVKNRGGDTIGILNKIRVYLTTNKRTIEIPLENYNPNEKLRIELIDVETDEKIMSRDMP